MTLGVMRYESNLRMLEEATSPLSPNHKSFLFKGKTMLQKLQQLIYGDRGVFLFILTTKTTEKNSILGIKKLHQLELNGYHMTTVDKLLSHPDTFMQQFSTLVESSSKKGVIFRKSFGSTPELEAYTHEEWMAIWATYSLRYGWSDDYQALTHQEPNEKKENYFNEEAFTQKFTMPTPQKVVDVWGMEELEELMGDILCSKIPLRPQQEQTLELFAKLYPTELFELANRLKSKIVIKEIMMLVIQQAKEQGIEMALFDTIKDILRFIALGYATPSLKGQITNRQLKEVNFRFKTSGKKFIKAQIEKLVLKKGFKTVVADMFPNERFWRRVSKLFAYQSVEKERRAYPNYYALMDALYDKNYDRSWSYNARFTGYLKAHRYDKAIELASERPGVLFRHLILFIKMKKGKRLPIKEKYVIAPVKKITRYEWVKEEVVHKKKRTFFDFLLSLPPEVEIKVEEVCKPVYETVNQKRYLPNATNAKVEHDAYDFFYSKAFDAFLEKHLNPKLGYQVLEEMKKEQHHRVLYRRNTQGRYIRYNHPIPSLGIKMYHYVSTKIKGILDSRKYEENKKLGKVYIDAHIAMPLQFSGKKEKSTALSGSFLPSFTRVPIDDLRADASKTILRLGVMWRALSEENTDIDLDHSVFIDNEMCYYGAPVYRSSRGKIIALSSGDWVEAPPPSSELFATELIDIDMVEAKQNGNTLITSVVNDFTNERGFERTESYFFVTFISKEERVQEGQIMDIALDKVDYAIALPKSSDNGCFGVSISLSDMMLTVLNQMKPKSKDAEMGYENWINIYDFKQEYRKLMKQANQVESLVETIGCVVDRTENIGEADMVISVNSDRFDKLKEGVDVLNPFRELERLNALVF